MACLIRPCSRTEVVKELCRLGRRRLFSSVEPLVAHRTIADPGSFTSANIGQWYTVPVAHLEKLSYMQTLPDIYAKQVETLLECSVMVRRPLLDLVNCLKHTNPDAPVCRFMLYGANGTGKSLALWQTVHWAHANGWIVCYVSRARRWNRIRTEVTPSSWKSDRFDLPLFATQFLTRFKTMNADLINQHQLVTEKAYTWTARENTPAGSPLMTLVDVGLARPKLASDCMGALFRELKEHSREKRIKLMLAVDMVNSFFLQTKHRRPDGNYMHASEVSLVHNTMKMCRNDWTNGAIVTTVDTQAEGVDAKPGYMPYYLLGQEGFELLDPFVPIQLSEYTEHEANSCLDYYIEKNWLQRPNAKTEQGRREIIHMSARNPHLLERTIASY